VRLFIRLSLGSVPGEVHNLIIGICSYVVNTLIDWYSGVRNVEELAGLSWAYEPYYGVSFQGVADAGLYGAFGMPAFLKSVFQFAR
jgi:hypothetical protein